MCVSYSSEEVLPVLLQDVIRTICSPYGFVQRIVIFRKNGLQVLVEYPHPHVLGGQMSLCCAVVHSMLIIHEYCQGSMLHSEQLCRKVQMQAKNRWIFCMFPVSADSLVVLPHVLLPVTVCHCLVHACYFLIHACHCMSLPSPHMLLPGPHVSLPGPAWSTCVTTWSTCVTA